MAVNGSLHHKMNKFTESSTKTRISLITYKAFRDIFSLFQDGRIVESLGDARSVTHNYAFILTQLIKPESSFFFEDEGTRKPF